MFKVLAHTADIALEVQAGDLNSLFIDAAKGWKNIVVENSDTQFDNMRRVKLTSVEAEDLMVLWLSELNYFLTVHQWIMHEIRRLDICSVGNELMLEAEVSGETLDSERHYIYCDIKAVTYHQLNIKKIANQYHTRIIFDL
jgi:SHS2 domain-containing protein